MLGLELRLPDLFFKYNEAAANRAPSFLVKGVIASIKCRECQGVWMPCGYRHAIEHDIPVWIEANGSSTRQAKHPVLAG